MANPNPCPNCGSDRTYYVMPAGENLKCMNCEHVWHFTFILFIQEWKAKVSA